MPAPLRLIDPILPPLDPVLADVRRVLEAKQFSNQGPFVRALERRASTLLDAPHAIAVGSGTLGLMTALVALGWKGDVILPAFTFPATAHAVHWAGLEPVFADIDPETFTLAPDSVARLAGDRTAGILPVTVFGVPPDLDAIADAAPGIPILLDDAQGLGSRRSRSAPLTASVLSLHATKTVIAGEGGLVLTEDGELAARIRRILNFGIMPDGDCKDVGLNAKMAELSAVLALHTLPLADQNIAARRAWAEGYRQALGDVPGLAFQTIPATVDWNAQFFALTVDGGTFPLSRNALSEALDAYGIVTRKYFRHPMHELACYRGRCREDDLTTTEELARKILCLPLCAATPVHVAAEVAGLITSLAPGRP